MPEKLPEGTITVLFTDVEGSTDLRTSRGAQPAHTRLQNHGEIIRRQVKQHSGYEVKSMGDGFMVAFASARSAVDCAVAIQRRLDEDNRDHSADEHVRVRIGLNIGEVIRENGDLFGEAVNAAARIMAKASGGQILVSETVKSVLGYGAGTELLDRGRFRLKGFPERWRLYEVQWRSADAAAKAPPSPVLAERTPFVGREEERAELRRLMEQAIAGHGSVVLIRGEPGVGKTRLAQELVLEARARGMADQTGRCYEMEGAPPYIPFVEMLQQALRGGDPAGFREALGENAGEVAKILPELRRVYDEIPPPMELPPEQERMYLFNSMREFVERVSRVTPLLLIIDDLHWADDATLLLLQHVAQYQEQIPMLTVATYRDIELDAARPLARTLEWLIRQRVVHRINLKPLPEAGVETMLQGLTGQTPPPALVQAIFRETEGNPFFVEEVFQHFSELGKLLDAEGRWRSDLQVSEIDVPEGVRLVLSRRLERVSEECRTALTDAAVVGRDFTFELLEKLTELDADRLLDAVDEAERANLIVSADEEAAATAGRPVEARFRFAHELIRQTLISGLSLPRRQRLHLRVAETIEFVYGRDADVYTADVAHHLYQAGAAADPAKTARFLALAGDQALEGSAFGDALRKYDLAFSLLPADDLRAKADLVYKRGLARRSLGRWDEAMADWREAADLFERLSDTEAAASAYHDICLQLSWAGRWQEVLEMSQRGLAALGRRESPNRPRLLGYGALILSFGGYHTAGRSMFKRALATAEKLGDQGIIGHELTGLAAHHWAYMQWRDMAEASQRGAPLLRKAGNLWLLIDNLNMTYYSQLYIGRLDSAAELWHELQPLAKRLGRLIPGVEFTEPPAALMLLARDIDALELPWRNMLEEARGLDDNFTAIAAQLTLGTLAFWRGRWSEALDYFQKSAEAEPGGAWNVAQSFVLLVNAYMGNRAATLAIVRRQGVPAVGQREGGPSASLLWPMMRAARASGLGLTGLLGIIRETRSMRIRSPLPRPRRPNTIGSWTMLFTAVEALAVLGERSEAAKLYPLVLEGMQTDTLLRWGDLRLLDTIAGIAAACGGKWPEAEEHFRTALRHAEELPHVVEQPEARRWYAWMLLERDASGDREKARSLLTEAIDMYRRIGMPRHMEMAEAMVGKV